MTNFFIPNTPFYFTGFYLAPAPAHSDTSWMNKRQTLIDIGYGFLIIYVGHQTHNLTYAQGQTDGANAVDLSNAAGFSNEIIYLDVEAGGGSISTDLLNYIDGWLDYIASSKFKPGVYCSYSGNADEIKNSRPQMSISFWVWRTSGKSPGCSTNVGSLSPSDSGVSYASTWQYSQNCSQTWNGTTLVVDLNLSNSQNPSSP